MGNFGSVVLIGGAVPGQTECLAGIRTLIENDDRTGAAARRFVLLVISFVVCSSTFLGSRAANARVVGMTTSPQVRTCFASLPLGTSLCCSSSGGADPVANFTPGFGSSTTGQHASGGSALNFRWLGVAIVVPLNVISVSRRHCCWRANRVSRQGRVQAIIDLPLRSQRSWSAWRDLLWGSAGCWASSRKNRVKIIVDCGIVLASVFARCHSWCARSRRCCTAGDRSRAGGGNDGF